MQESCLVEIFIADMLGIFLILGAVQSGAWKLHKQNREDKLLLWIMTVVVVACVTDAASFAVDGCPGRLFRVLGYASNFILFLANLFIGTLWVMLLSRHIYGMVSKFQKVLIVIISGFMFLLLVVNLFYPIVFEINDMNIYSRGPLFMLNNLFEIVLLLDGIVIYWIGRERSGEVKFFPVLQFIWPVVVCVCLQNLFYGISTIWVGVAIGFTSLMLAFQNENIFTDKLTRLFNRYYLDRIVESLKRKNKVAVMMLDMNGFKSINDNYGHSQGDDALLTMAGILRESVEPQGMVVRYAGDEFLIVLNTEEENVAKYYYDLVKQNLMEFNKKRIKQYKISASIGMGIFDFKKSDFDEILEIIDKRMYEDKKAYYALKLHDRRHNR